MFPPRLTRQEFKDLFTEDIYCDYIFEKLRNAQTAQAHDTIERKIFVEYAMSVKDIYMWVSLVSVSPPPLSFPPYHCLDCMIG